MNRITAASVLVAALSAGCADTGALGARLQNRLVCTASGDKAMVVSEYGPVGIASNIADADGVLVCASMRAPPVSLK